MNIAGMKNAKNLSQKVNMRRSMINTLSPISYGITYRDMPKSIRQKEMGLDTDYVKKVMWQEHFQQDITKMDQKYL